MLPSDFLGGVVEGFYGQAWAHHQRLQLVDDLAASGLNTYFYAPKNDLKHRAIWRECYSDSELAPLREVVDACERRQVRFIYGLSPGLDICFSDEAERDRIKLRFDQLWKIGVRHFALLFDDLPGRISEIDGSRYESLAAAQSDVTNAIFAWVRERWANSRFLFCPTPYCDRMDRVGLGGVGYLDEIGARLSAEIDVLWTGLEIVSAEISVESIERLSRRIRRPPVIWDNLFANDYDFSRLFCGPYSGRSRELRQVVRGILINPNNEYPINFIPLKTLAAFLTGEGEWKPSEAFKNAAADWLGRFTTVGEPLALADLILLADCFYLPHADGPEAQKLIALIDRLLVQPVENWGDGFKDFSALHSRVQVLFDRLTELRDRELFDAWSRRAWALKEEMLLIGAMLDQKKAGGDLAEGIELEHCMPGTFRGGILTKLQSYLSMNAQGTVRISR